MSNYQRDGATTWVKVQLPVELAQLPREIVHLYMEIVQLPEDMVQLSEEIVQLPEEIVQLPEEMLQYLRNGATTYGSNQRDCATAWGNGATQEMMQLLAERV